MKKITWLFLLLLALASQSCFSQVCKISNSNDNIEVFNVYFSENNTAKVIISNDSNDTNANVTVTIDVVYKSGVSEKTMTYSGKGLSKASSTSEIIIPITPTWNNNDSYMPSSVKATRISGTKCL